MISQHEVQNLVSSWLDQVSQCDTLDELFTQINRVPASDPSRQMLVKRLKDTTHSFIRAHFLASTSRSRKLVCAQWGLRLVPQPILVHIFGYVGFMTDLISCAAVSKNFRKTILDNKRRCFGTGMIEFVIPLYQYNSIHISTDPTNRIICTGVLTGEKGIDLTTASSPPIDDNCDADYQIERTMSWGRRMRKNEKDESPALPSCLEIIKGIDAIGVCLNKASAFVEPTREMTGFIESTKCLEIQDGFRIDSVPSLHVEKLYLHIGYDGYHGYKNIDVDYASLFPQLSEVTLEFRQFMENKRLPERFPRHLVTRINIWNVYCCGDLVQKLLETEQFPNLKWLGLDFQYFFGKHFRCTIPPIKTLSIVNPSNFDGINTWMASYSVSKIIVTLLVTGLSYDPTSDLNKINEMLHAFVNVKELVIVVDVRSSFRTSSATGSSSYEYVTSGGMDVCCEIDVEDLILSGMTRWPVLKEDVIPADGFGMYCGSLNVVKLLCDYQFEIGDDLLELFEREFNSDGCHVVRESFVQSGAWEKTKFRV